MLQSIYISLIFASFALLLGSLLGEKMLGRAFMAFFAALLFSALALSSVQIDILNCDKIVLNSTVNGNVTTYVNDTACTTTHTYNDSEAWIFWSFTWLSLLLGIVFSILAVVMYKEKETI